MWKLSILLDIEDVATVINHPVHILTKDNKLSPSALIPFCEFGGNMGNSGVKIDQFEIPVCNSFQAKILNDQLCYQVDLRMLSNERNIKAELELGFNFIMDYNEDRQVTFEKSSYKKKIISLTNTIVKSDNFPDASIYLDTIGKFSS